MKATFMKWLPVLRIGIGFNEDPDPAFSVSADPAPDPGF
jgi:hypothetical protein